ncbi:MAG: ATP synthase F1 subunit delta [Candidatus Sericytochromatia bacterium]|nr:ATP synthase F1 subunit delta [Candidatus Sericytochromatia bacterium]
MSQVIANRYAEALFRLAKAKDLLDAVDKDLGLATQAVAESQSLRQLLEHPLVAKADKTEMVRRIFTGKVDGITLNFLQLLQDRGRGTLLEAIQARFHQLVAQSARRTTAHLRVARHPGEEAVSRLRARLETSWQKQVELDIVVDEQLVAGARLRVDDEVLDGSLRARLDTLKQQLLRP